VLDLGTGSGLVAIAAAMAGASEVRAADTDPDALAAVGLNASANGVAISSVLGDLTADAPTSADVVLAGDLFYEPALARAVTAYLDRCLEAGMDVLVGDVGRAHLPTARLVPLAEYPVTDFAGRSGAPSAVGRVFRFGAG
jgi:predicted nicotinamide N-methyase